MSEHHALDWIDAELRALHKNSLYRSLRTLEGAQEPVITIEGRAYLCFGSNNYLGLSNDARVVTAARDALAQYGVGAGGSRLITGNSVIHRALENALSRFKGTEEALVFTSGYQANVGTITALVGRGDTIYSDALNHASIIDGCRLSGARVQVYPHKDMAELRKHLREESRLPSLTSTGVRGPYRDSEGIRPGRKLIVTDSVFSMDGDIAHLPDLVDLADEYNCILMVDEAHATGILGPDGAGAVDHFGLKGQVPVVLGTLSKAVGAGGGYVAGERRLIEFLRNRARAFIFTTGLSPALAGAALAAIEIIQAEPERRAHLRELARILAEGLRQLGYNVLPVEAAVVPVLIGAADRALLLAGALQERGIFAPAIRPPTVPPGGARIRLALMATHTETQVRQTIAAFADIRPCFPE